MEDLRLAGQNGRLGTVMTAVVVDGEYGKEYRLPTEDEIVMAAEAEKELPNVFAEIPFGLPEEPLPTKEALGFRVPLYGFDKWYKLFTPRQLLALGTFVKYTRTALEVMRVVDYPQEWVEAVSAYLALVVDRIADRGSNVCHWDKGYEKVANTFSGFRLPMNWDFVEASPSGDRTGSYTGQLEWVTRYIEHAIASITLAPSTAARK